MEIGQGFVVGKLSPRWVAWPLRSGAALGSPDIFPGAESVYLSSALLSLCARADMHGPRAGVAKQRDRMRIQEIRGTRISVQPAGNPKKCSARRPSSARASASASTCRPRTAIGDPPKDAASHPESSCICSPLAKWVLSPTGT